MRNRYINFGTKYINLAHVATIKLDETKNRIYFNMDYSILVNDDLFVQDYIFVEKTQENLDLLADSIITDACFVEYEEGRYVNKDHISSFRYDKNNNRVIINLCTPHTYEIKDHQKVLSEFIYKNDVMSDEDFEQFVVEITE